MITICPGVKGVRQSIVQQSHNKKRTKDWLTIIPLIFWVICIAFSIGKQFQGEESNPSILSVLNSINESTFSTYITMVITLSYQFFSVESNGKRKGIGLSREHISVTIISTCIYGCIALINVCRYCSLTTILMFITSIVYVLLFFRVMRDSTSF